MRINREHLTFYALEFLVIGFGFAAILYFDVNVLTQILMLIGLFIAYTFVGVFHHAMHNNISSKVVLEYILISVLLIVLFVFVNISRI